MLVAGSEGIGKTWLCLNVVKSAVLGRPLFANPEWPVTQSRVLFVEPEVKRTMRARMDFVFADALQGLDAFDYFSPPPGFSLLNNDWASWFKDQIDSRGYDLIILDSIGRIAPHDENDNTRVGHLLEVMRIVQGQSSLIWTMHFGKRPKGRDAENYDALDIENIRGAKKWSDDIDGALMLNRRPGLAVNTRDYLSWVIDYGWQKTRHVEAPLTNGELVFNLANDGQITWRPKQRGGRAPLPTAPGNDGSGAGVPFTF